MNEFTNKRYMSCTFPTPFLTGMADFLALQVKLKNVASKTDKKR